MIRANAKTFLIVVSPQGYAPESLVHMFCIAVFRVGSIKSFNTKKRSRAMGGGEAERRQRGGAGRRRGGGGEEKELRMRILKLRNTRKRRSMTKRHETEAEVD